MSLWYHNEDKEGRGDSNEKSWYGEGVVESYMYALLFVLVFKIIFCSIGGRGGGKPDLDRINATAVIRTTTDFNLPYMMDAWVDLNYNQNFRFQYIINYMVGFHKSIFCSVLIYVMSLVLESSTTIADTNSY